MTYIVSSGTLNPTIPCRWSNDSEGATAVSTVIDHNLTLVVWQLRYPKNFVTQTSRHCKYRVAHKKRPQLYNDIVPLNNRIQTKRNNILKEQS